MYSNKYKYMVTGAPRGVIAMEVLRKHWSEIVTIMSSCVKDCKTGITGEEAAESALSALMWFNGLEGTNPTTSMTANGVLCDRRIMLYGTDGMQDTDIFDNWFEGVLIREARDILSEVI